MNLFVGALTLFVALVISAVAGFFSVIGLGHLFAGAFWPVVIMGSALETGKLVAATWLKANWTNPAVTHKHRMFLLTQTLVLMLITSLGIYGYLAKGHLEQEAGLPAITLRISQGERRIAQIGEERIRLEDRLKGLDQAVQALLTNAKTAKETQAADRARQAQRRDRLDIAKQIAIRDAEVNKINDELVPLKLQISDVSAKLGPVKYVAQLFGWHDPNSAVQMVILMIMFAFDPLAVVLVLSGTLMIGEYLRERRAAQAHGSLKSRSVTDMAEHLDAQPIANLASPIPATDAVTIDDLVLDSRDRTRGTLVTELPKVENLTESPDLTYFEKKLAEGLKVPASYTFNADPPPNFVPPEATGERPFADAVENKGETAAARPAETNETASADSASIVAAALSAEHAATKAELAGLTTKHEALTDDIERLRLERDAALAQIDELASEGQKDESAEVYEQMASTILRSMDLEGKIATLEAELADAQAKAAATPVFVPAVYGSVIPVSKTAATPAARLANTSWGALGAAWKPSAHAADLGSLPSPAPAPEAPVEPTAPIIPAPVAPAAPLYPGQIITDAAHPLASSAKILTAAASVTDTTNASVDFHEFSEGMFKARDK